MARIAKAFSFSNVVAFIALFVALGGSVYAAGKLSGIQIKPNSIPGNRIKAKTLTGKQVKPNSLTGSQINEGTLTGVSASSLASVQYVAASVLLSSTSPNGTPGAANCPAGTYVIGGGATVNDESNAYINDSGPNLSRTGWTATGFAFVDGTTMTVTAICTPVAAVTG